MFILSINIMSRVKIKERAEIKVSGIVGFLEGRVTPIGNGAKIGCPKEFIGRRVYIIFLKD